MAQINLLNFCKNTLEKGAVLSMQKGTAIVGAMPFKQINGNAYSWNIIDTLLPTSHRKLGEDIESNEFQTIKCTRDLLILTNSVKTDRALGVVSDITDIKAEGLSLAMISSGKALEQAIIEGLKDFINNSEAGKLFNGVLDTDFIDDMIDYCNPNMIFVNSKGQRELKKLLKSEGMQPETIESFGKRVVAYDGIPVHVAEDLQDNEILLIQFGDEAVHGITNSGLNVYEQERGVFHIADCEILYNVVAKVKNSFALGTFTTNRDK